MIVAVEGPSAAGKTTWCSRHGGAGVVEEYAPTGAEPDGSDLGAQADYWVAVNSGRWARACSAERETGLAVCDSDPLKLHYSWCLSTIGATPRARWEHELAATREAFAAGRLGLADLVLVGVPAPEVLRQRRDGDPTRRRRHFELHARLGEPLRQWYTALDRLSPGRVVWELPGHGLPPGLPPPRPDRSQPELLDALVAALPD